MTADFSKPHRGVSYFGLWATDTADDYGRQAAATVLAGAVDLCADEDMRADREVVDALAYLSAQGHDKTARRFRKALDVPHPDDRTRAAAAALDALNRGLGLAWGKTADRF